MDVKVIGATIGRLSSSEDVSFDDEYKRTGVVVDNGQIREVGLARPLSFAGCEDQASKVQLLLDAFWIRPMKSTIIRWIRLTPFCP